MEKETNEKNMRKHQKLLYVLLSIIVILVVITGSCFYYVYVKNAQLKIEEELLKNNEIMQNSIVDKNGVSSENNIDNTSDTEELIAIYGGVQIKAPKIYVYSNGMSKADIENENKYSTKYYCYDDGKFVKTETSELEEGVYEDSFYVDLDAEIGFNKKFNITPREIKKIEDSPNELIKVSEYTKCRILQVDLDGNNTDEYIVFGYVNNQDKENPESTTTIILYDSNFNKVATLLEHDGLYKYENSNVKEKVFIYPEDIECIDIDNDNIMEILIEIPIYEGGMLSVIKYENGKIYGETDYKSSVNP